MDIRIYWLNYNTIETTITLYRDTQPIDRENLPEPLVTLPHGSTEYIHEGAIEGITYYYVFESVNQNDRSLTNNIPVSTVERTGPGPQFLQVGDYEYGYFGEVMSADFFSGPQLVEEFGIEEGEPSFESMPLWQKVARRGKIFFVPTSCVWINISWAHLYSKGLVYGVNEAVEVPGLDPVNQYRTVTLNGDQFLIRLMRGSGESSQFITLPEDTTTPSPFTIGSEIDEFIYPLCDLVPETQQIGNFQNYPIAQISRLNSGHFTLCQELIQNTSSIDAFCRLDRLNNVASFSSMLTYRYASSGNSVGWRPILEYLPQVEIQLG